VQLGSVRAGLDAPRGGGEVRGRDAEMAVDRRQGPREPMSREFGAGGSRRHSGARKLGYANVTQ
jgi:hypothetical protein